MAASTPTVINNNISIGSIQQDKNVGRNVLPPLYEYLMNNEISDILGDAIMELAPYSKVKSNNQIIDTVINQFINNHKKNITYENNFKTYMRIIHKLIYGSRFKRSILYFLYLKLHDKHIQTHKNEFSKIITSATTMAVSFYNQYDLLYEYESIPEMMHSGSLIHESYIREIRTLIQNNDFKKIIEIVNIDNDDRKLFDSLISKLTLPVKSVPVQPVPESVKQNESSVDDLTKKLDSLIKERTALDLVRSIEIKQMRLLIKEYLITKNELFDDVKISESVSTN